MDYYSPFIKLLSFIVENKRWKGTGIFSIQENINLFLSTLGISLIIKNNDNRYLYFQVKEQFYISFDQLTQLIKRSIKEITIDEFNNIFKNYNVRVVKINNGYTLVEIISEVYL